MLLLDSGRPARQSVAIVDIAELQEENDRLLGELRRQRRRRTIRRIRRLGFVVATIGRVAARHSAKGQDDSAKPEKPHHEDRRAQMVVAALVLIRLVNDSRSSETEPKSAAVTGPASARPAVGEVRA